MPALSTVYLNLLLPAFFLTTLMFAVPEAPVEETAPACACPSLGSTTYTVTNTNDSGAGSLREAIGCANIDPVLDNIEFNIPGGGPHVIAYGSVIPAITDDGVIIDGLTQPGNSTMNGLIELSPGSTGPGIEIAADDVEIYGLSILGDNSGPGITMDGVNGIVIGSGTSVSNVIGQVTNGVEVFNSSDVTISEARIGTNLTGSNSVNIAENGITVESSIDVVVENCLLASAIYTGPFAEPYNGAGLRIVSSNSVVALSNIIGLHGSTAFALPNDYGIVIAQSDFLTIGFNSQGNTIAGNNNSQIMFYADSPGVIPASTICTIQGNLIGINSFGTTISGGDSGISLFCQDCTVGGTNAGEGNNIIGFQNGGGGIGIADATSASGTLIQGNTIQDCDTGIGFFGAQDITVGGSGAGNDISNNSIGVAVYDGTSPFTLGPSTGITILENSIYCNTGAGIDIQTGGAFGDGNNGISAPAISAGTVDAISGSGPGNATIEVFIHDDSDCFGVPCQGRTLVGTTTANGAGSWTLDAANFQTSVSVGQDVTASATLLANGTSEFSGCLTITSGCTDITVVLEAIDACTNQDYDVNITLVNGTPPYDITITENGTPTSFNNQPSSFTWVRNQSVGGSYTYEVTAVTDDNGCTVFIPASSTSFVFAINGGTLTLASGGTSANICVGDGTSDFLPTNLTGSTGGATSLYVLVDAVDNILATSPTNDFPLDGLAGGTYFILHIAHDGSLGGASVGNNLNTDLTGCYGISSGVTINATASGTLNLSGFPTDPSCPGASDGSINITVNGAQGPVVYDWDPDTFDGQEDLSGLTASTYALTVSDDSGCQAIGDYSLFDPPAINLTGCTNTTDASTATTADGSVTVNVSGGTPLYDLSWTGPSPGSLSNQSAGGITIPNLLPGDYMLTVTDDNGCMVSCNFTIGFVACNLAVSGTTIDPSCFGVVDGAINLTVTGAVGTPSFAWSDGTIGNTEDPTGLHGGFYEVTVTDGAGCEVIENFTLFEPAVIQVACSEASNASGPGNADGSASVTVMGGTPGYDLSWSGPSTGSQILAGEGMGTINGLLPGDYSLTVLDVNGCTETCSFTINLPACNLSVSGLVTDVVCFGESTGSIDLTVTGAIGMASFAWSDGSIGNVEDPSGLPSGNYSVTVTDQNACTATDFFFIDQPNDLIIACAEATSATGPGNADGSAAITINGGTSGYELSWTGPSSNTQIQAGEGIATINNLLPGDYQLTVTDVNNCTEVCSFTINLPDCNISLSRTFIDPACAGENTGSIDLTVTGAIGNVSFAWSDGSIGNVEDPNGLAAGTYMVTVTDDNNCTATITTTLNDPPALTVTCTENSPASGAAIADGSADITRNGGTSPYLLSWSGPSSGNQGSSTGIETITGLLPGDYSLTVMDDNGCTTECMFTITAPGCNLSVSGVGTDPNCAGEANGSIELTVTGAVGTPSFSWSDGSIGNVEDPTGLVEAVYMVTVTDENACTASTTVTLTDPPALVLSCAENSPASDAVTADGSADVTLAGGSPFYSMAWSGPSSGSQPGNLGINTLNNLLAGDYSLTVTYGGGCEEICTFTINEVSCILMVSGEGTDLLCNNDNTGSIELTVTGVTGIPVFTWSDGSIGNVEDPAGLAAALYGVTVTDDSGCSANTTVLVEEPSVLLVDCSENSPTSDAVTADGAADVSVMGGTPPYTLAWDGPSSGSQIGTATITNLLPGDYTLTVTDDNGCMEVCTFSITIQNNDLISISGLIYREDLSVLSDVDINLSGGSNALDVTGLAGDYEFDGLTSGLSYVITPFDDANHVACVTITDLLIIGEWILGSWTDGLSPYQLIAADANNSGTVTTADLILIRQLVLGEITEYPNNTSWRFVPADYVFPNENNPWEEVFPEIISLPNLAASVTDQDFIGTKIGDLNLCQEVNPLPLFTVQAPNITAETGTQVDIDLTVEDYNDVAGFQFSLVWDETIIEFVEVVSSIDFVNTYSTTDRIMVVCNSNTPIHPDGTAVITLRFNIIGGGGSQSQLQFGDNLTTREGVDSNYESFALNTVDGLLTVTGACALTTTTTTIPALCGTPSGSATITVSGGSGNYDYNWSTGAMTTQNTLPDLSPGSYDVTVIDGGCDEIVTFEITDQNTPIFNNEMATICEQDTFFIGSMPFTESGSYFGTVSSVNGCDSTVLLSLEVLPIADSLIVAEYCSGDAEEVLVNGTIYNEAVPSGMEVFPGMAANGCDSVVLIDLTFISLPVINDTLTLCPGEDVTVNDFILNVDNPFYADTLSPVEANNSCGLIRNYTLTFHPAAEVLDTLLCSGSSFTIFGTEFSEDNPIAEVSTGLMTVNNCDSTIIVNASFVQADTLLDLTICVGDTVEVGGDQFYFGNSSGEVILPNAALLGCDSTIMVELDFFPEASSVFTETLCENDTLFFNGEQFYVGNETGEVVLENAAENGCDLTIQVSVDFLPVIPYSETIPLCEGEPFDYEGETYFAPDIIENTLISVNGCDSVVTLVLEEFPTYDIQLDATLCAGDSITIGGETFSSSGSFDILLATEERGCDSLIQLELVVLEAIAATLDTVACSGDTIIVNGEVFTEANSTADQPLTSVFGCDSLLTVSVLFTPLIESQVDTILCAGESIEIGGQLYDSPLENEMILLSEAAVSGCDSVILANVSFYPLDESTIDVTLCEGESYLFAEEEITMPGQYVFTGVNSFGCDSTVTLNLDVVQVDTIFLVELICPGDGYEFCGQLYFEEAMYSCTYSTLTCDSVVILNLLFDTPDALFAEDDAYEFFRSDGTIELDILENDLIDEAYQLELLSAPQSGELELFDDRFRFTPDDQFFGLDSFQYALCPLICLEVCDTATVYFNIEVNCLEEIIQNAPTAFSPGNGDGVNDTFDPVGFAGEGCDINPDDLSIIVVNVNGEIVFQAQPYQWWDGTSANGATVPEATYFYLLEYDGRVIKRPIVVVR